MGDKVYSCYGDARRGCGVRHRTPETARACIVQDQRGCSAVRGYSDRRVYVVPAGRGAIEYHRRVVPEHTEPGEV